MNYISGTLASYQELVPDVWYFEQGLSWLEQKALVKFFLKYQELVYTPRLRSGHEMNLKMLCLGQHWSAKDYQYHAYRKDYDQLPVLPMEPVLSNLAHKFCQIAFPQYNKGWDLAIINYYHPNSTLGLHQDNSESQQSLQAGDPIVSFSIGAGCDFQLGGLKRKDPTNNYYLNSGDVLIFGGTSRLRYHGIKKIHTDMWYPFRKFLNCGRLNFTLRKL